MTIQALREQRSAHAKTLRNLVDQNTGDKWAGLYAFYSMPSASASCPCDIVHRATQALPALR